MYLSARYQPGFVLLLTLVLLAMAAVAMAGIGRRSVQQAVRALDAEAALQQRWAVRSASEVLLPQAEALLADEQAAARIMGSDPAVVRRTLRFGPYDATLLFGDEQAKLNLNTLFARQPAAQVRTGILQAIQTSAEVRVELRPFGEVERQLNHLSEGLPAFTSFAQVLPGLTPAQLMAATSGSTSAGSPAHRLTLWGDGRVHVHRADPAVLAAALSPELTAAQAGQLVTLRQAEPSPNLKTLLDQLQLEDETRTRVAEHLTETSLCHSLWIVLQGPQRTHYTLVIQTRSADDDAKSVPPILHRLIW